MPLLVDNRDDVQKKLAENGLYAPVLWPLCDEAKAICENSNYVSEHMLALPIDQRYDWDDIEDIAKMFRTNKEFLVLEKGYCDLRKNHTPNVIIDDEDDVDTEEIEENIEDDVEETEEDIYYDNSSEEDDVDTDGELSDFIVVDEDDDNPEPVVAHVSVVAISCCRITISVHRTFLLSIYYIKRKKTLI